MDLWEIRQFWERVETERTERVQQSEQINKQIFNVQVKKNENVTNNTGIGGLKNVKTMCGTNTAPGKMPLLASHGMSFLADKTSTGAPSTRLIINGQKTAAVIPGSMKNVKTVGFPGTLKGMGEASGPGGALKKYMLSSGSRGLTTANGSNILITSSGATLSLASELQAHAKVNNSTGRLFCLLKIEDEGRKRT